MVAGELGVAIKIVKGNTETKTDGAEQGKGKSWLLSAEKPEEEKRAGDKQTENRKGRGVVPNQDPGRISGQEEKGRHEGGSVPAARAAKNGRICCDKTHSMALPENDQ
jgi:hypothetical protein